MTTAQVLVLDRYRLDEQLAVGGTARVWRGWDVQLGRPVAVKLLHPHLLPDETSRRRLAAEARAAAALSHPAIATVYDVSGPDEDPAVVMELVDGEALSARLAREGPIAAADAARIAVQIAAALFHAHQRGIIHRDVKPANILLEANGGDARLIDFGIARSLELATEPLTRTGTSLGTPRYMAPEQLAGEEIGPRTDLWGLGAVLYEMLAGLPPFRGGTPLAIAREQAAGPPPMDEADSALEAVARACMAVPIADRPLHAGSVADALRAWAAGDTLPAHGLSPAAAVTAPMTVVPAAAAAGTAQLAPALGPPTAAAGQPRRMNSRRAFAVVAGLVLAAALVGVAAFALSRLPQPAATVSATAVPTSGPPVGWRNALVAEYRRACANGDLETADLAGRTYAQATRYVDDRISACQTGKPSEPAHGAGNGKGHAHGHGPKKD